MKIPLFILVCCLAGCLSQLFGPRLQPIPSASVGVEPSQPTAHASSSEHYTISQVVVVAGAVIMLSMDNNPTPSTSELQETFAAVFDAYSEAMHLPRQDVEAIIRRYSPAIYLVEGIDCGRAHDGVGSCGGFIAGDNSIHINMANWRGCLAHTSLQHFLVHYLEGVLTGSQDGRHEKPTPWQAEQEARRRVVVAQQQCRGVAAVVDPMPVN